MFSSMIAPIKKLKTHKNQFLKSFGNKTSTCFSFFCKIKPEKKFKKDSIHKRITNPIKKNKTFLKKELNDILGNKKLLRLKDSSSNFTNKNVQNNKIKRSKRN